VNPTKTAEPIEMPFVLWTRVGPGNNVLDGVQIPMEMGNFGGKSIGTVCCERCMNS